MHSCNPRTQEVKAGESDIQNCLWLYSKFDSGPGYLKLYLHTNSLTIINEWKWMEVAVNSQVMNKDNWIYKQICLGFLFGELHYKTTYSGNELYIFQKWRYICNSGKKLLIRLVKLTLSFVWLCKGTIGGCLGDCWICSLALRIEQSGKTEEQFTGKVWNKSLNTGDSRS